MDNQAELVHKDDGTEGTHNPLSLKNIFLGDRMMHNMKQIEKFHIIVYIMAGIIAGILGVTGFAGLLLLLILTIISSIALVIRLGGNITKYTILPSFLNLAWNGVSSQALTFVLFWTFAYTLVHIY